MSGKAASRALRAYSLTEAALVSLLLEKAFNDDKIENKNFKDQLTNTLQQVDIVNKEAFLETKLCRYVNDKVEKLK